MKNAGDAKLIDVILDTNVIISGMGWGGTPGKIIELWKKGKIKMCISAEILEEYLEVLQRGIKPPKDYQWFIRLLEQSRNTKIIKPVKHFKIIKEDPDDNIFLDCAVAGKVKYIISGDRHLLDLKLFKGTKIMEPDEFLRKLL